MRVIADIAKENDLYVISDEVYREFVYGGEEMTSMLEFPDTHENVIVVDSVSKRFSACGARVGALVSRNRAVMTEAMKICQTRLCVATLDQVGAAALYSVEPATLPLSARNTSAACDAARKSCWLSPASSASSRRAPSTSW